MYHKAEKREFKITNGVMLTKPEAEAFKERVSDVEELEDAATQAGRWGCSRACKVVCSLTDLSNTISDYGLDVRSECSIVSCQEVGVTIATQHIIEATGIDQSD